MSPAIGQFAIRDERERRLAWQSRLVVWIVLLISAPALLWIAAGSATPATAEGLLLCAAFGVLVWALRAATPLAALTGFMLTACIYLGTVQQPDGGWFHTALSAGVALFVLAFLATRFGRAQKERSGLAESRRGRRASQVAANMGAAALATLSARPPTLGGWHIYASVHSSPFTPLIAALAEAAGDTVSSEIGQTVGGKPVLLTTGRRVAPGTDGGVTILGTTAGAIAAALVVLIALPTLRLNLKQASIAWLAALAGFVADSLFGATIERRGWFNNDMVNFLSTLVAALLAALVDR